MAGRHALNLYVSLLLAGTAAVLAATNDEPVPIARATGDIVVDGKLTEEAWRAAAPASEVWFEINVGDNVEPQVANKAWLLYDDKYFYAAFDFADPEPEKIRAPLGDHDYLPGYTDYGGIIVNAVNDGKTAQMFLANARGVQYDALSSDTTGEDSSPDYHWDAAGHIDEHGWTLEIRVPLSSIRYSSTDWRILLYRNYPRDRRYQFFSSRLPRDVNCFICNSRPLVGLEELPTGGHYVLAPVVAAAQAAEPVGDLGTPLENASVDFEPGIDFKWIPSPNMVIDATVNPDFSQVESDVAQITANERFALFFPEKRPFFLEGTDLFSTPVQAVYSRTFTSPRWGGRVTGKAGKNAYTILVGEDEGGGSVILPGPRGSDLADQDFKSLVAMGRWRRDVGERSFLSFLTTGREVDGGGSNRVFGPDFQWRPNDNDTVTGQFLVSKSQTPDRADLAAEWNGQTLEGYAAELWWQHATGKEDWFLLYNDYSDEFRADNGFVPRVGYRIGYAEVGYTFRPERGLPKDGFLSRLRTFAWASRREDQQGGLLDREVVAGAGMDGRWNSFFQVRVHDGEVESEGRIFPLRQIAFYADVQPSQRVASISLIGWVGKDVDFANSRPADGASVEAGLTLTPTEHLALRFDAQRRLLEVDVPGVDARRLFTADLARLRAVYTFNSRAWLRWITQWVETRRDPRLYTSEVEPRDAALSGSLVFAYKLNWQSVLFVGYGDDRVLDPDERFQKASRELFFKISYAFQR